MISEFLWRIPDSISVLSCLTSILGAGLLYWLVPLSCVTSILAAGLLYWLVSFPSSVSSFRIVVPPFHNMNGSFLALAKDPSFVPPFHTQPEMEDGPKNIAVKEEGTTHFCFLVHGFSGMSTDLSYLEATLKRMAQAEKKKETDDGTNDEGFVIVRNDEPSSSSDRNNSNINNNNNKPHDMVIHNALCNERKTLDGVANGGDRIVLEMRQVIYSEMNKRYPLPEDTEEAETKLRDITISMVGNSLGGLYARYAIAKLIDRHCVVNEQEDATTTTNNNNNNNNQTNNDKRRASTMSWILDGKYRLRLNIFCTTASPHLGVSQHTWIKIPRFFEHIVGRTMGQSGRDMFRLNDLLYKMATDPLFLKPLAAFRKRIAYANCYGTDFPVPVGTAAFLSERSSFPHTQKSLDPSKRGSGVFVASLSTSFTSSDENYDEESKLSEEEYFDELHEMSVSLDRLGWEKVFVDFRKELLRVEIPKPKCLQRRRRTVPRSSSSSELLPEDSTKTISSQTIVRAVTTASSGNEDRFSLHVPAGHNMIVAWSRDRFGAFLNRGGRPVVDTLAKELAEEIFAR